MQKIKINVKQNRHMPNSTVRMIACVCANAVVLGAQMNALWCKLFESSTVQ